MALWQLLNLGTGCTVTHCWIALWSHESAQTASSERSKYANSEHTIYIYIVSKVGGRDYEQLIASFHLGSPPYSPFGAVIQQGFLRK